MAKVVYKQLKCRDAGGHCDFIARARTEDDVLMTLFEHLCLDHGFSEIIPWDTELKWRVAITNAPPRRRRSRSLSPLQKQPHSH